MHNTNTSAPSISARIFDGIKATTADGRPARLALIDEAGNVISSGREVEDAALNASVEAYRQMLLGNGHLRIYTKAEAEACAIFSTVKQ